MKGVKAIKCSIRIGNLWQSPILHILITKEDEVYVARCLDFKVSSHGDTPDESLQSVKSSIVEYARHSIENNITSKMIDSAQEQYWILFRELELKEERDKINQSLKSLDISSILKTESIKEEMVVYA